MAKDTRIYLIGFMGCGKTTFGRKLARRLDYDFIDLDLLVESMEKLNIAELFTQKGEAYFRQIEADVLRSTILMKKTVISCGGGTPCYHDNMEWILERGLSVYLKMSPVRLYERLKRKKEKRPLIAHMSKAGLKDYITQKLAEREAFYMRARLTIDMETAKRKSAFRAIAEALQA